jgi:rhamnose transport system permease protein
MAISAPAVPGSGEAVKQSGRKDVKVIGLSLPNLCKPYVHEGWVESVILWDTANLGYLTVLAARATVSGELKADAPSLPAGRLGQLEIKERQIILGAPFIFNKSNIDKFDF